MTVRGYTTALTQFAAWFEKQTRAGLDPARLTPLDVRRYRQYLVEERRRQPATVNQHLTALRAFARWGQVTAQAADDPTQGVKPMQQVEPAPRWLTQAEQYALLRAAREEVQLGALRANGDPAHPGALWPRRDYALLALLLNTGLRLAEAAALQVDDVTLNGRSGEVQVRQGKGRKARNVPLNKDAREALQAWLDARNARGGQGEGERGRKGETVSPSPSHPLSPSLFLSQKGGALSERAISERVRELAGRAGLAQVSPHTLRHSFAKNLVDAGVGLEKVAALLGHANLNTTRRYVTPSQADLQAATERVAWGE